MLVLKRHEQERIIMDGGIVITLVEAKQGYARIGIEAPLEVNVRRAELPDRRQLPLGGIDNLLESD